MLNHYNGLASSQQEPLFKRLLLLLPHNGMAADAACLLSSLPLPQPFSTPSAAHRLELLVDGSTAAAEGSQIEVEVWALHFLRSDGFKVGCVSGEAGTALLCKMGPLGPAACCLMGHGMLR